MKTEMAAGSESASAVGGEAANSDLVRALATIVGAVSTPQAGQGQALSQQSAAQQVQTPATLPLPLSQPAGTTSAISGSTGSTSSNHQSRYVAMKN